MIPNEMVGAIKRKIQGPLNSNAGRSVTPANTFTPANGPTADISKQMNAQNDMQKKAAIIPDMSTDKNIQPMPFNGMYQKARY